MKFLKTKHRPQPETSFERFIHSQPVFNWFDRYDKAHKKAVENAGPALAAQVQMAGK